MPRYGKILKVEVTPYHILDVMEDPAYMKHFFRRFNMAKEELISRGYKRKWFLIYGDDPQLLYEDAKDEIKKELKMQEASASQLSFSNPSMRQIVLSACSDWITEKTGRKPEFEILQSTLKSVQMNLDNYGLKIID